MWAVWSKLGVKICLCRRYEDVGRVKWFGIVFGKEMLNKEQD